MAAYVLHVVDREHDTLVTTSETPSNSNHYDFLFEVLTGPFAGERGSHRELSELIHEPIIVMSGTVGICSKTGTLLDWQGSVDQGTWAQRHQGTVERVRAVGAPVRY
jgi:hypothetical protein